VIIETARWSESAVRFCFGGLLNLVFPRFNSEGVVAGIGDAGWRSATPATIYRVGVQGRLSCTAILVERNRR